MDGFGKPVCMRGKTCDDEMTRRIRSREQFPTGFSGEVI
jgi:hypothetical protein